MSKNIILITGASSGFGLLAAQALALWGIETTVVVPGAFTNGTNHFGIKWSF
ncbi:hypothetical protein [Bordetella muralis]|uniref:hypothetical protein n=1 Tax=Bordetella muralis TaxID=1649130 RepID=UPI0039F0317D